jgi:hypothetical protein
MVLMLMVRGRRPAQQSGRCSALSGWNQPDADSSMPPRRCRHAPGQAGQDRHQAQPHCRRRARAACRSSGGSPAGSVVARSREPGLRTSSALMPQDRLRHALRAAISHARSRSAGQRSALLAMLRCTSSSSSQSVAMSSCITADARAPSVPGSRRDVLMALCRPFSVMRGSMQTSFAPSRLTPAAKGPEVPGSS